MNTHRRFATACHSIFDDAGFALCLAAFAFSFAGLVGTVDPGVVAGPPPGNEVAAAPSRQSLPGDLAVVYVDGTPVYRLAGMTVSASRAVEMARMERESRSARLANAGGSAS